MTTVLRNIAQLATCPAAAAQQDAGLIDQAALVFGDGRIAWAGPESQLPRRYADEPAFDCGQRLVVPGLVDCHTHLCFGGWRGDEFAMRLAGRSYQEIAAGGGGIRHTVEQTRAAATGELRDKASRILDAMLDLGVTTVECKSGYGLDYDNEIRLLEVYAELGAHPVDLVATFLGAHVVPDEYRDDRDGYVALLCQRLLPEIAARGLAKFCDVFVEKGAFSQTEAGEILRTAAALGLGLKVHADQLSDGGGAELAAELGAVSAEHLEYVSARGMAALAASGTIAVSLPLASLYLRERYMPARQLMDAGARVAVATDFNPGSAPSYHLPLAMTLACLNQQMTPAEVLTGATTIAARALGLEERAGSLQSGYPADIAILDAPNLNHWLYHFRGNACCGVVKSGRWIKNLPECPA